MVGQTITANATNIFCATGTPGGHDGKRTDTFLARRERADIANRKFEQRVEVGVRIHGVCASEKRVFAACADGLVRVFAVDLSPLGPWSAPAPGEMALDGRGNLWVIDSADRVVRRFRRRRRVYQKRALPLET